MPSSSSPTRRYLWVALVGLGSLAAEAALGKVWEVQELGRSLS